VLITDSNLQIAIGCIDAEAAKRVPRASAFERIAQIGLQLDREFNGKESGSQTKDVLAGKSCESAACYSRNDDLMNENRLAMMHACFSLYSEQIIDKPLCGDRACILQPG
jgi:hypothetical protein